MRRGDTWFQDNPALWGRLDLEDYNRLEVSPLIHELERLANKAREHLADDRLNHPDMEAVRAALLRALLNIGALAIGREE
jgi:hypothetical protein